MEYAALILPRHAILLRRGKTFTEIQFLAADWIQLDRSVY
jgi:hypothetical protein